ncbi:MAG: hypothetical protein ACKUBY_01865 [Candidatus Moraniibacteriota bacterium]|jgi:hypothetical protein
MQQQLHQVTYCNRFRNRRRSTKKKYWFKCLHALPENPRFEYLRSNQITFNIYLGHYNAPVAVEIKKIRHLRRSRFGKRVELSLIHVRGDKSYKITAIYNINNGSMVIHPVPKFLFAN